jgi:hypothetical protein
MAQPQTLNLAGSLPPEIMQQQQALNRQQQMAQLLMQQGQSMPSGQMVSGRYVAPSFFQYAAPLFQTYAGKSLAEKGDKAQADLAKALRQQYANEMTQYRDILRGKEQTFEQAGPTQTGGNIPNQTYRTGADPEAAYLFGSTAYNPVLQQLSAKKLTEGPKYKEVTQYNQQTGNTEIYRYDENSANPRDTMQFIGISKPAISPEAQIRFGDEGIGIPAQFRGGAVGQPQGQPTSAYGANVQFTPNQPTARPQVQPMGQPSTMPVAGAQTQPKVETKTTPVTLQRFGYDPFQGPELPKNVSGKDARALQLEQKKSLTGDAAKTVSGATNYMDALTKYKDYVDTLTATDLANPQVRIALDTKHKQVLLTGKEANNLGVLNGGDERILNAVMPNYSDILVTKNTLGKVIQDQREFGSGAIVAQYRTSEKAVPERLRKYVEIDIPTKTESKNVVNDIQSQLRSKGIPYQPKLYEYRVNPDGSVDRKRKIL